MRPTVRIVFISTLALSLWWLVDGIRCLVTGTYFGRVLQRSELPGHPHALALPDGTLIDYGAWAGYLAQLGLDPHQLAPFFVATGALGLVGLFLFLQARPIGWAMLIALGAVAAPRMGLSSVLALVLLVTLMLPSTRALFRKTMTTTIPSPSPGGPTLPERAQNDQAQPGPPPEVSPP